MTVYTEVIQDGMLALLDAGKVDFASATAFSVSPDMVEKFKNNVNFYKDKVILRPHPSATTWRSSSAWGCWP